MNNVVGLRHVATFGVSPETARAFYAGVLGLSELQAYRLGEWHISTFECGGDDRARGSLSVICPMGLRPSGPGAPTSGAVVFATAAGALGRWTRYLSQHGVAVVGKAWAFGEEHLCFTDPFGRDLALVEEPTGQTAGGALAEDPGELGALRLRSVELTVRSGQDDLTRLLSLAGLQVSARQGPLARFRMELPDSTTYIDVLSPPLRRDRTPQPSGLQSIALTLAGSTSMGQLADQLKGGAFPLRQRPGVEGAIWVNLAPRSEADLAFCRAEQPLSDVLALGLVIGDA